MSQFDKFWDVISGPKNEPLKYSFLDYGKEVTDSQINCRDDGDYTLKPLAWSDMARYGADDVVKHYLDLHQGKNPNRIGDPMSDHSFKKFFGQS